MRVEGLLGLARGAGADAETAETVRRIFVETVLAEDRQRLLESLDEALLARDGGYAALWRRQSGGFRVDQAAGAPSDAILDPVRI